MGLGRELFADIDLLDSIRKTLHDYFFRFIGELSMSCATRHLHEKIQLRFALLLAGAPVCVGRALLQIAGWML